MKVKADQMTVDLLSGLSEATEPSKEPPVSQQMQSTLDSLVDWDDSEPGALLPLVSVGNLRDERRDDKWSTGDKDDDEPLEVVVLAQAPGSQDELDESYDHAAEDNMEDDYDSDDCDSEQQAFDDDDLADEPLFEAPVSPAVDSDPNRNDKALFSVKNFRFF